MNNFILFGMPASGKGTQATLINNTYNDIAFLSMGQLLRNEVKNKTKIGSNIEILLKSGNLIKDDLINQMVSEFLQKNKKKIVFYDGYPRTLAQAEFLNNYLHELYKTNITMLFYLDLPDDLAMQRMCDRVVCGNCGAVFNLKYNPPKKLNVCDYCLLSSLAARSDDNMQVMQHRIKESRGCIKNLLLLYKKYNIPVCVVDASKRVDEIFGILRQNIDAFLLNKY